MRTLQTLMTLLRYWAWLIRTTSTFIKSAIQTCRVPSSIEADDARSSGSRARLLRGSDNVAAGSREMKRGARWRQVNRAVTELTGYSEEQLLAMTFQDITHPEDLDLDLDHLNRLVAGEITSYQMEKRYFTATGRIMWVLLAHPQGGGSCLP